MHFYIPVEVVDDQFLTKKQIKQTNTTQKVKRLNRNKQKMYTFQGNYCQEIEGGHDTGAERMFIM
jgi:ribose 5-phosphate isomerase